jgi:hypothetical protein
MNETPRPDEPRDEGPEEIDDVEEISGGYQFPDSGCIPLPPIPGGDLPWVDYIDPLGDGAKKLEL